MTHFPHKQVAREKKSIGLLVLQADETIEDDFRELLDPSVRCLVSRVPSSTEVSLDSLGDMAGHISAAAALFPRGREFDAVGYACTSGTAQIGVERILNLVRMGTDARSVSEPVSALVAACKTLGVRRIAILSPYVESVSEKLRSVLTSYGIATPIFGSFREPNEASVARIDHAATLEAARALSGKVEVDALFLSCTNLPTLAVIDPLEAETGRPVLSSNLVLAWHLMKLVGAKPKESAPGVLMEMYRRAT